MRRKLRSVNRFRPEFVGLEPRLLLAVDVLTYHNDVARDGLNASETILNPSNVNSSTFGLLGVDGVDGKVDAEPLYVSGVTIPGQGTHNVLYVATENDSLYAFDADTGTILWHDGPSGTPTTILPAGEVPSDNRGSNQISPQIGITDTPVIDPTTSTIYFVAMSKKGSGSTTTYYQRLHAVDITTGADKVAPKSIDSSITYPGQGPGGNGSVVIFDPKQYAERNALLLVNGVIYTGWTSHSDHAPYTGWVMGFNASDLSLTSVLNIDPNGTPTSSFLDDGSGNTFWNSGSGFAADASGNIYNISANGPFSAAAADYGDSFLKFSTASGLAVSDYFTPYNQQSDANGDLDVGSSGILLLPDMVDSNGVTQQLAIGSGKDGNIYVVNRDNMGGYNSTSSNNSNVYQEVSGELPGGIWSAPAYFNGQVYFGPVGNTIRAFSFSNAKLSTAPTSQTATKFAYPGATPSISANGTTDGIVWAVENASGGAAVLHAYDATNLADELYNSTQAGTRDQFGSDNKFITPMIANGKVYVGTTTGVAVFGLLPTSSGPTQVDLSSSFNRTGIVTDGSTFSGGGLDGDGNALSANLLGPAVNAAGVTFNLGPAGAADVVSAAGQTIALPSGRFGTLSLLATGVNGSQANQPFTVTYSDGTQATSTRSISDWAIPQGYTGESTAVATAYRDVSDGTKDSSATFNLYTYSLALDPTKTVQSLTLPDDGNVEVLGIDLLS